MHMSLMLLAVTAVCLTRLWVFRAALPLVSRWQHTLGLFLFAPLFLLAMAVAILGMGTRGQMLGLPVGWIGYSVSLGFLGVAVGLVLWRGWLGWRSLQQVRTQPAVLVHQASIPMTARVLNTSMPFAAQVGFWQPELVLSQGALVHLSPDQLTAVLTHEQAHLHYRDTFWFFWLGWLRQLTSWLPYTEALWQELLLLRELRADRWAAQQVDALLIAEALLLMTRAPLLDAESCAMFGATAPLHRLEERINALLTDTTDADADASSEIHIPWMWLALALLPLFTVMLHR
ncbi:MAG: M56 family metallopeptidase [Synechococcales cyanobacterium M58_A2018_015]|nr:M56 family metallopeptidase [Synechococcales cyanobacterium M58_A2018_015]